MVDSSAIEVNQRLRRAKNDRIEVVRFKAATFIQTGYLQSGSLYILHNRRYSGYHKHLLPHHYLHLIASNWLEFIAWVSCHRRSTSLHYQNRKTFFVKLIICLLNHQLC